MRSEPPGAAAYDRVGRAADGDAHVDADVCTDAYTGANRDAYHRAQSHPRTLTDRVG